MKPLSPVTDSSALTASRPANSLFMLYLLEGMTSISATLLNVGVFYYAVHEWKWQARHNLVLSMAFNAVYMVGALSAGHVTHRFGRRMTLAVGAALSAATALAAGAFNASLPSAALIIFYSGLVSFFWPAISSLVSNNGPHEGMSRRLGIYNLVWAGTFAVSVAMTGTIIKLAPMLLFAIPVVLHGLIAILAMTRIREMPDGVADAADDAPQPEPALLHQRTLALWLSRIALPGTFILTSSLWAMFPLLPSVRELDPVVKTIVTSVILIARVLAFAVLTFTIAWHSRPRLLLTATIVILMAYLGITIRPSDLLGGDISMRVDLISLIFWQIVAGVCLGLIYSASLYFGMVLSRGSARQGGYHESLIGLGGVIGPGIAAAVQWQYPGNIRAGITPVVILMLFIIAACIGVTIRFGTRKSEN
jgi:MFS family permease